MKQWILWTGVLAATAAARGTKGPVEDDGRSRVEVIGLAIRRPLAAGQTNQSLTGRKVGTAVTVRISHPAWRFVGVDTAASTLESFADDRGTELVDEGLRILRTWLDGRCWVSDDGHACALDLLAMKVPSRRAGAVKVRAKLGLLIGQRPAAAEQRNFRLAKDSRLRVGPVPMKLTGVQHADKSAVFTLSTKVRPDRIGGLRFLRPDGSEYETRLVSRDIVGFMGETYYDWTYSIKDEKALRIESVTVRVEYFGNVRKVLVPVDVTAGVGL